jgi:hypothetical protein
MPLNSRFEYLETEQEKILNATERIEKALELAGNEEFSKRVKGLLELRALSHVFDGIGEHCHSEERIVQSTFRRFLDGPEYSRVVAEHTELLRLLNNFREELEFATADSAGTIIPSGKELIRRIREHIIYERTLLERISAAGPVPEEVLMRYTESPE